MVRPLAFLALAIVQPVAGAAQTPSTAPAPIRQLFGVMTPMRDGVKLASDIWLPAAPGRYPVILIRTTYLKSMEMLKVPEYGEYYASRGYIFAVQDTRGRGDSEGNFNFFFQEVPDG